MTKMIKKLTTIILTLVIFTQSTTQGYKSGEAINAKADALRPMAMKASSAGVNAGNTAYKQSRVFLQGFMESDTLVISASLAPLEPIFRGREHRKSSPETQLIDCVQMLEEVGVKGLHIDIKDARYIKKENLQGNMDIFNPALIGDIRKTVEIPIDIHLMVMPSTKGGIDGFKDYIAEFIREGARFISVQWGAFTEDGLTENDLRGVLRFIKENGACAGLAINPDEDVNQIIEYSDDIDYAMVMASMPGDNTRRFDKRAHENLKILSSSDFDKLIAVGGDIYRNSIANAKRYGGKWFFAGRSLLGVSSAISQINTKELMRQAYRLLIEKATAVEPFPSKAQYKKWHKRLQEPLEKADALDEEGYIKDIPTLMDLGATFFAAGKGKKGLRSLVVTYSAAAGKYRTQIPEGSTVYHFILKDLGFVTDEMWQDYLAIQRLVLPDELKQIWQERLQKALSEADLLDGENNIKDHDALLAIEPEFFTSEEHKKDLLPIYLFYQKAVKKDKIPKDKQFTPLRVALVNLGFISPKLRDEHISYKTRFPSEALRKKYTASMETALKAEQMLNKEGKIKDIGLLLDIDLEFFKSRKDEEGGPGTIVQTYYMRASKYNVKKDEGSTVYHFILKDLGFVTDEMWQDYLAIKRAIRSKGQAQRWYAVLERTLTEAKKLTEGKIKDLATLLTITEKFFVSKKHRADILAIYLFYTNPVYLKRISMPPKALPACFILKDMGLVSDALWYEYLEYQGAGALTPFLSEKQKAEWKSNLEKALEKMLDKDSKMIADIDILMGIGYKFFVDDKSKGGLDIIYRLYSKALQRGQTTKPEDATVYHFILKDMNLILPSVWDEYLACQDREKELARKKREFKRKKEAFLDWPEKEAWRLELEKVLWKAHMLNRSRQIKGIDILMNLNPEFFTETHKELAPIYTRYEKAVNAGILKIPKTFSIQCWILKEMGFISKELWGKYLASGRATSSIYHRKRWHAICKPILKKAGMLSREKNMIKNLDALLSIEPAFFTQEHKELAPIYGKYEEGVSTKQLKIPEGISTICFMLKDLGFITEQLWLEYIKPIWSEMIRKVAQDADILDAGGKIGDLKVLLLFDNISFWHDNELRDIILAAGKLFKEAAVSIPPTVEFHIFLLKELGFIAPELLQEYTLYKTNPLSFEFQKDEWRRILRQVLQQDNLLDAEDEEAKIGSLDVLLNIDRSFFTKMEDSKRIYNVYKDALNRKRTIQLPQWTRLVHFILWHLDLIEPEIWDAYLSIPKDQKTAFVTTANKEKWKKRLLQDLEQAGLLNKDNKIKNLNTLLDIKAGSLLTSIYNPYSHAIKYGLIEKPESAKTCHFLLRDLNFITDDLWEEYIKYNISPILSDSTREEWLKTLRKFFPKRLIDKQGKIKDYHKLLEEANHIFCSDKRFVTIYRCYYAASTNELLQEILGIPEDVNLGFYILSDLGMVDIEQLLDILDQKLTGKLNTDRIAEAATMVMYLEPLVREASLQTVTDEQKARIAELMDRISEAMREPRQFRLKVSRDINRLLAELDTLKKEIKALYSSQTKKAGASEEELLKIQQLLLNELFENMKQRRADAHILRVEVSEYNRAFGEAFPIKDSVVERFRILKSGITKLVRAFRQPELLFNEEFWKEEPRRKKAIKGAGKTEPPAEETAEEEAELAEKETESAEGEAEPAEEEAEQEPEVAEEEPTEEDISKEDQEEPEEIAGGSIPYKEKVWQDYTIFYAGALLDWLRSPKEEDCKIVEPEDIRETLAALENQWIKDIFQQLRSRRVDKIVKIKKLKALLRIKSKFFTSDRSMCGRNYIFKLYQKAIKDGVIEKPENVYLHHFILHELGFISEWVWKEYMQHRDAEEKAKLKPPWKEDHAPTFPSEEQKAQWQARLEPAVRKALNEEKDIAFIEWRHLIHRLKQVLASNLCDWGEPPIREKAFEIVKGLDTDAIKAEALWHWVRKNIAYREGSGQDWDTPASATLEIGHGMSFNRANLMIAMARSIGIPAKYGIVKFGDYITGHVFVSLFLDHVRVRFDAECKPGFDIPESELHLVDMDKEASRRAISGFYIHEADSTKADTEKKKRPKRKYSRPTIWDLVTVSMVRKVASRLTAQGILPTPEAISEELAVLGKKDVLLEELSPKDVVICAANNEILPSILHLPESTKAPSAGKSLSASENGIVSALQLDDDHNEAPPLEGVSYAIDVLTRLSNMGLLHKHSHEKMPSYTEATLKALEQTRGNCKKAAQILVIQQSTLTNRLETITEVAMEFGRRDILERLWDVFKAPRTEEILATLEQKRGNQTKAAKSLGILRATLRSRLIRIRKRAEEFGKRDILKRLNEIVLVTPVYKDMPAYTKETLEALIKTGSNRMKAAEDLGISPAGVSIRLKKIIAAAKDLGGGGILNSLTNILMPSWTEETLEALAKAGGNPRRAAKNLGMMSLSSVNKRIEAIVRAANRIINIAFSSTSITAHKHDVIRQIDSAA